ncbi:homeodomain-like protein [Tanacetum coccineum]
MIKYSFGQDEEYLAIKEDEYKKGSNPRISRNRFHDERRMDGNKSRMKEGKRKRIHNRSNEVTRFTILYYPRSGSLPVSALSVRTRRSKARTVTLFANPERQFRARREVSPVPIHNIYSFYESESSESDSENVDIETLTLEQYLALGLNNTRKRSTCPDNSMFEVKGQLLRELHKISFSGGSTDSVVKHISNVLKIASIFNTQDSTLIQIFPLTLEGIAKRWFKRTSTECTKSWSDLRQNFIRRFCPPAIIFKQLGEIQNFKQEG